MTKGVQRWTWFAAGSAAAVAASLACGWWFAPPVRGLRAQEPLAKPPQQEYVGPTKCAPCHFKQFMSWKKDKHSQAFSLLEGEYQTDEKCLPCHTTGYGEESGYQGSETPQLANVTCEVCHGPGSKHVEIAKQFSGKQLTEEQEAYVRSTIHLVKPGLVCVECHVTKAHHPSPHPPGVH